jgi:hypothetical protein
MTARPLRVTGLPYGFGLLYLGVCKETVIAVAGR